MDQAEQWSGLAAHSNRSNAYAAADPCVPPGSGRLSVECFRRKVPAWSSWAAGASGFPFSCVASSGGDTHLIGLRQVWTVAAGEAEPSEAGRVDQDPFSGGKHLLAAEQGGSFLKLLLPSEDAHIQISGEPAGHWLLWWSWRCCRRSRLPRMRQVPTCSRRW